MPTADSSEPGLNLLRDQRRSIVRYENLWHALLSESASQTLYCCGRCDRGHEVNFRPFAVCIHHDQSVLTVLQRSSEVHMYSLPRFRLCGTRQPAAVWLSFS